MMVYSMQRGPVKLDTLSSSRANTITSSYSIIRVNSAIGGVKNYTEITGHNCGFESLITLTPDLAWRFAGGEYRCSYLSIESQICNSPGNKKGSTANATSLNCIFLRYLINQSGHHSANRHRRKVQLSDDLVLRLSDLIFFSQASITHDEKFEFSCSTQLLISSTNSCGKRIPLVVDLLFLYPVAIDRVSFSWCRNTIQENFQFKILDVFMHLAIRCLCTLICNSAKTTTPRSATNTIEAFNHKVMESYDMAMHKSTQTHPKFKWRFFSCQQSRYFTVEACSEQEARSLLPDAPCLFSARIRQGA